MKAKYYTVKELAEKEKIPELFDTSAHLIYSSPATLAYNSPGAQGFGVKRAGLTMPESVMLIVSPGCCGRNTSAISVNEQYQHRYFYYLLDETDIVTGRHLSKIPEAVKEIVDFLEVKPKVVMICVTCVDALLGTDMERVCKVCEEVAQVKVRPCYMYALTREGRRPPMVHVRESLYSLLDKQKKDPRCVNLLGFFAPLDDECELYRYLKAMGIKTINELSRMMTYEDFTKMSQANFNLILHPEARVAAQNMRKELNIGSIELKRFYQVEYVHRQYQAFANALGTRIDDQADYEKTKAVIEAMTYDINQSIAIGETGNYDPFELALALVSYGLRVKEIYATLVDDQLRYVKALAALSPEIKVYCNNEPTMLYYDMESQIDLTIGKDAAYYHPQARHLYFNEDRQPYGYQAIQLLFSKMKEALA